MPTAVSASIGAYSRLFLLPRVFVGIFDSAIVALVSVVRTPFRPFAPLTETHVGQNHVSFLEWIFGAERRPVLFAHDRGLS